MDAGFAPLDFAPAPGAPLALRVGEGADARTRVVGRVRALAPGVPVGVANLVGFELAGRRELVFHGNAELSLADPSVAGRGMTLLIDGAPALAGFPAGDRVVFYPLRGSMLQLAPAAPHYREITALPDGGGLALAFHHPERGVVRAPLAEWRRQLVPLALAASPLPVRIGPSAAIAADHR